VCVGTRVRGCRPAQWRCRRCRTAGYGRGSVMPCRDASGWVSVDAYRAARRHVYDPLRRPMLPYASIALPAQRTRAKAGSAEPRGSGVSWRWAAPGSNRGPLACRFRAPGCRTWSLAAIVRQPADELPYVAVGFRSCAHPCCYPCGCLDRGAGSASEGCVGSSVRLAWRRLR
jgi:hypothetical protein